MPTKYTSFTRLIALAAVVASAGSPVRAAAAPARSAPNTESIAPVRSIAPASETAAAGWTATAITQTTVSTIAITQLGINDAGDFVYLDVASTPAPQTRAFAVRSGQITKVLQTGDSVSGALDVVSGQPASVGAVTAIGGVEIDAQGRVYLAVEAAGFTGVLRWQNGAFTRLVAPESGFVSKLGGGKFLKSGHWLEEKYARDGVTGVETFAWKISNGVASALAANVTAGLLGGDACNSTLIGDVQLADPSTVAYVRTHVVHPQVSGTCQNPTTVTTEIIAHSASGQVVLASHSDLNPVSGAQTGQRISQARVNGQGGAAYVLESFSPAGFSGMLVPGDVTAFPRGNYPTDIVPNQIVALNPSRQSVISTYHLNDNSSSLWHVDGLTRTMMLSGTAPLFGKSKWLLQSSAVSNSALQTLFVYAFSSTGAGALNRYGLALLTKAEARWITPAGGAWNTAGNWLPAKVPDAAIDVRFDLNAAYDVDGANALNAAADANVDAGSVAWKRVNLTGLGMRVNNTATLAIEAQSRVTNTGEVEIGGGASTHPTDTASVFVDAAGGPAHWLISNTFSLGNITRGELYVDNGAEVEVAGLAQVGLVAHGGAEGDYDGRLLIQGSQGVTQSSMIVQSDLLMGMASGATTLGTLADGGNLSVLEDFRLGHTIGSVATLELQNTPGYTGEPSTLSGGLVNQQTTGCRIGPAGTGFLVLESNSTAECGQTILGGDPGSKGFILVNGAQGGTPPKLTTLKLCVGGGTRCNANKTNVRGVLSILNGGTVLVTQIAEVGAGGSVHGNGVLDLGSASLRVLNGGAIDPGLETIIPLVPVVPRRPRRAPEAPEAGAAQPGTLVISGSLSLSPTAVITIDVTGATAFDKLTVTGPAALDGKLALNFSNGYAPKQGDVFTFLQSGGASGAFAATEITGLAPGFTFTVGTAGGVTRLVANNDGMPNTARNDFELYLPLTRR